jgi:alkylated DNA repair dioxygenase AlkB
VVQSLIDDGLLLFLPNFLSRSQVLFERLVLEVAWDDRIRARRVASFGVPYNYSGTVWPQTELPPMLMPVADAVAAAIGYSPNNCLANYYPDGNSVMGYHSDSVTDLPTGTGISIVSLGAPRVISFRRELDRTVIHELILGSGSLLHMTTTLQAVWRHAILRSTETVGGRISLTFRRLKKAGDETGRPRSQGDHFHGSSNDRGSLE